MNLATASIEAVADAVEARIADDGAGTCEKDAPCREAVGVAKVR